MIPRRTWERVDGLLSALKIKIGHTDVILGDPD